MSESFNRRLPCTSELFFAVIALIARQRIDSLSLAPTENHLALVEPTLQILGERRHAAQDTRDIPRTAVWADNSRGFRILYVFVVLHICSFSVIHHLLLYCERRASAQHPILTQREQFSVVLMGLSHPLQRRASAHIATSRNANAAHSVVRCRTSHHCATLTPIVPSCDAAHCDTARRTEELHPASP